MPAVPRFRVPAPFMLTLPPTLVPPPSVIVPPTVVTLPLTPPVVAAVMLTVAAPASLMFSNPLSALPPALNVPLVVALKPLYVAPLPVTVSLPALPTTVATPVQPPVPVVEPARPKVTPLR